MINKTFVETDNGLVARVAFTVPESTWADVIYLVGDFNDWHRTSHPFQRDREGNFVISIDLQPGRAYQFRYLRDDADWANDSQADCYVHNPYGSSNFVVVTDRNFKPYRENGHH